MDPFATVADLESRWRTLSTDEKARAETLLGDGTAIIASKLDRSGITIDKADEVKALARKIVCCAMVRRVMDVSDDMCGISQMSQTVGPFSGSRTFANPNGDMYLTANEKNSLGIGRQRIGSIYPSIGGEYEKRDG